MLKLLLLGQKRLGREKQINAGDKPMNTRIDNEELYIREKINQELTINSIPTDFTAELISRDDINRYAQDSDVNRKDLTDLNCLTIDGADTKEIDDAVSIQVTDNGYVLGVHIADCAAFVADGTALAEIALERGTSIYFPGYSVPMFPLEISQDICSLTEGVDKRVVSMLINYDFEGNVVSFDVKRAYIRTRVRGVYSEVNSIIDGKANEHIMEKYNAVLDEIVNMSKLADILRAKRAANGVPVDPTGNCRYGFNEGQLILTLSGKTEAELMIREFMLAANTCMSQFFADNNLPGFYRNQDSMSFKARYSTSPSSHESLGTPYGYLRYTSPIRRCSDYLVHVVLCSYLSGTTAEKLNELYLERFDGYCLDLQKLEDRGLSLERRIINECHMLYFARHNEESYVGIIAGKSNKTDESILYIQPYGIRIIGSSMLSKFVGQEFLVKVMVDNSNNLLRVGHISRMPAA